MNGQDLYPFASGDLLDRPNTYFYSKYRGRAFLEAWQRQRADASRDISGPVSANASEADTVREVRKTDALLESIYCDLSSEVGAGEIRSLLDRLVQRFEVTKRLHGEYGANWRPTDPTDYRLMERYVRFGEILDLAYERTGALPYLNALLKTVDTLTASRIVLNGQQRQRLQVLIAHERDHVKRLASCLTEKTNVA